MSANPEEWTIFGKVLGAAGTVLAVLVYPLIKTRGWLDKRFEQKADRTDTERCLEHIEKLYVNAEADRRLTRDLVDKLMDRMIDVIGDRR